MTLKISCEGPSSSFEEENKAAIIIQKFFRKKQAYLKAFLDSSRYSEYVALCQDKKSLKEMPQAQGGYNRVYLPQGTMSHIVIKQGEKTKDNGKKSAIERFVQMLFMRSVLDSLGDCSDLVLPRTMRPIGSLCVEERLPITVHPIYNMKLYALEPRLFDNAVKSLVKLFSKVYLSCIICHQKNSLYNSITGQTIRYDNFPLYVVVEGGRKVGKIGLIDLERLETKPNPKALRALARIFPYHVDIIIEEAQKLDMPINLEAIHEAAHKGKNYIQKAYLDHVQFLKRKGIREKADTPFQVREESKKILIQLIQEKLLQLTPQHQYYLSKLYAPHYTMDMWDVFFQAVKKFGSDKKTAYRIAEKIYENIIQFLSQKIEKSQEKRKKAKWPLESEEDIVHFRSLLITEQNTIEPLPVSSINSIICLHTRYDAENMYYINFIIKMFSEKLFYAFFQELVHLDELCYFSDNPEDPTPYRFEIKY